LTVSSLYSIAVTRSQFNRVWDVWWNGKFASWMFSQQIYSNCEKISEECFQHLVESMPWRIKAVLKAKVGQDNLHWVQKLFSRASTLDLY